jgi:ZIP family zinc transporter/zinc and cadmium transporter
MRILLAGLLGVVAAGANLLGGVLVAHRQWSRQYLKYFIALGAGFMLATALLEMFPESVKLRAGQADSVASGTEAVFVLVLAGYFVVHFFEHTVAPHFHFGEETHHEEVHGAHASYTALLGLVIHTFFDGVAIASGLLVSTWLGGVIFIAIFLHKIPEGFTVASLMLASGQSRAAAFISSAILGAATLAGMALMFAFRPDSRGEPRAQRGHGGDGFFGRRNLYCVESNVPRERVTRGRVTRRVKDQGFASGPRLAGDHGKSGRYCRSRINPAAHRVADTI